MIFFVKERSAHQLTKFCDILNPILVTKMLFIHNLHDFLFSQRTRWSYFLVVTDFRKFYFSKK
mgnify:CR=1 FL=1